MRKKIYTVLGLFIFSQLLLCSCAPTDVNSHYWILKDTIYLSNQTGALYRMINKIQPSEEKQPPIMTNGARTLKGLNNQIMVLNVRLKEIQGLETIKLSLLPGMKAKYRIKYNNQLNALYRQIKKIQQLKQFEPKPVADTTPPSIKVFSPKSDRAIMITAKYDTVIEGVVRDDSGVAWVTVNGLNAALDEQGNFNREAYLKIGRNDIEIKAMDTQGNIGTKIVTIYREMTKEIARIEKPLKPIIPSKILKPTLWLLSIGVSDYRNKGFSLNFADNDAIKLAEVLKKQQGQLYYEVQTKVLVNEEVTRESIINAMGEFLGQAALNDVIFIFIAGHGVKHKATGSYYFLPYDADSENLMIRGLRWSDFEEAVKVLSCNVSKIIFAIDTCHAAAMKIGLRGTETGEDLALILKQASGFYTLASSKRGEESIEHNSFKLEGELEGHGAFTYTLLKGILGEANYDGNEYITVSELFNFVAKKVPRITKGKQHPYAIIYGTDLPLAQIK